MPTNTQDEKPLTVQGIFNQLMPAVIIATLLWFGGKVEKSDDSLVLAQVELQVIKASLREITDERRAIVTALNTVEVNKSRLTLTDQRIDELMKRVRALERELAKRI